MSLCCFKKDKISKGYIQNISKLFKHTEHLHESTKALELASLRRLCLQALEKRVQTLLDSYLSSAKSTDAIKSFKDGRVGVTLKWWLMVPIDSLHFSAIFGFFKV